MYIKSGGSWKAIEDFYIKVSGSWKQVLEGYIKVAGAWKKFWGLLLKPQFELEISGSINATTKLVTLTGTNYYWSPGPPVLTYKFQRSINGGTSWSDLSDPTSTGNIVNPAYNGSNTKTYLLPNSGLYLGVLPNVNNIFRFYIYATYGTITGEKSSLSNAVVAKRTYSVQGPTNVTLSFTSKTASAITMSWTASTGANSYIVYKGTNINNPLATETVTTALSYTATGLNAGVTYYFKVKPITGTTEANPGYFGNESNTLEVTTNGIEITFDADGGLLSSGPGNGSATYTYVGNSGQTFQAPSATRTHYTLGIAAGSTSDWRYPRAVGDLPADPTFLTELTTYTFGDVNNRLDSSKTFYAKWTANTYTVSFNYSGGVGGSGTPASLPVQYPGYVTLPAPDALAGYDFDGWYTAQTGGTFAGLNGTNYYPTSNITLYARYTAKTYTINYDANGGSVGTTTQSGAFGTTFTTPTPTRANYTLVGNRWQNPLTGGPNVVYANVATSYTFGTSTIWANQSVTSITMYAIWSAATYTVSFNYSGGVGGSGSPASLSVQYPGYVTLPAPDALTGYSFDGWYTASTGGTYVGGSGTQYYPSANITLYARYTVINYSVSFNANGGTLSSGPGNGNASHTYTGPYGSTFTVPSATRQHYTFSTWRSPLSGGDPVFATPNTTYSISGSLDFYAIWTANTYTVSFNYSGGVGGSGTPPSLSATYPGFVTLPTPDALTGFTFDGWYTAQTGGTFAGNAGSAYYPTSNITLYAKYTANSYNVTFDANGGSLTSGPGNGSASYTYSGVYNSTFTVPTASRSGFTFSTWRSPLSGGDPVFATPNTTHTIIESRTFYAIWTENVTYYVGTSTCNANSGCYVSLPSVTGPFTGALPTDTLTGPSTARVKTVYRTTYSAALTDAAQAACIDCSAPFFPPSFPFFPPAFPFFPPAFPFFPPFFPTTYTITWDANGGTGGGTTTQNAGVAHTAPSPGTRSGFTFSTWRNPLSGGDPIFVSDGGSYTPTGNMTFYAIWSANVTYYTGTSTCNANSGCYVSLPSVSGPFTGSSIPSDTLTGASTARVKTVYRTTSSAALTDAAQAACIDCASPSFPFFPPSFPFFPPSFPFFPPAFPFFPPSFPFFPPSFPFFPPSFPFFPPSFPFFPPAFPFFPPSFQSCQSVGFPPPGVLCCQVTCADGYCVGSGQNCPL